MFFITLLFNLVGLVVRPARLVVRPADLVVRPGGMINFRAPVPMSICLNFIFCRCHLQKKYLDILSGMRIALRLVQRKRLMVRMIYKTHLKVCSVSAIFCYITGNSILLFPRIIKNQIK